ncbi:hypothetical protein K504DRAFT_383374 [Pleomassaria siparia CBS 279.74]|uniref:RING-type domain-containing protein n=1 Tax=Pleomassaria siparia CBS 279.74 TaxID=1314801 RepID=A0A6G1K4L6_9PLEO|nr:hypothetical protein K504DRAFT_383374 [Pleomassaria siparia CBS 279.74]
MKNKKSISEYGAGSPGRLLAPDNPAVPANPTVPANSTGRANSTVRANSIVRTNSTEPGNSTVPVNPTELGNSTVPLGNSTVPVNPTEPGNSTEPVNPTVPGNPAEVPRQTTPNRASQVVNRPNLQSVEEANVKTTPRMGLSPRQYGEICQHHSSDDDCTICLEPLSEGQVLKMNGCHHFFHYSCIFDLINSNHTSCKRCPVCRHKMSTSDRRSKFKLWR